MNRVEFPISQQYKKFECFFRAYDPDSQGNINITLRMNTVNDTKTYRWAYGNIKDYEEVGSEAFFKPLIELDDELRHLAFVWEGQDHRYSNGKYIKASKLYAMPVFDGKENIKQVSEDEPFPAMRYVKSLK